MKVIFPVEQYKKWRAYINAVDTEISGLGKISHPQPDIFVVEELQIFNQVVSGGHTVLDEEALASFFDERMRAGDTKLSAWKLWWHSHAFMDAYFSQRDKTTIEDWDNESYKNNWLLSIVSNKKHETQIRLDVFSPIRITIENIPFEISYIDPVLEFDIQVEVDQKVSLYRPRRPFPATTSTQAPATTFTLDKKGELVHDATPLLGTGADAKGEVN